MDTDFVNLDWKTWSLGCAYGMLAEIPKTAVKGLSLE